MMAAKHCSLLLFFALSSCVSAAWWSRDVHELPIQHPSRTDRLESWFYSWVPNTLRGDEQDVSSLDSYIDSTGSRLLPESIRHHWKNAPPGELTEYARAIRAGLDEPLGRFFLGGSLSNMDNAMDSIKQSWQQMRACLEQHTRSLQHNTSIHVDDLSDKYRMLVHLPHVKDNNVKVHVDEKNHLITIEAWAETEGDCGCPPDSAFFKSIRGMGRTAASMLTPSRFGNGSVAQRVNDTLTAAKDAVVGEATTAPSRVQDFVHGSVEKIKDISGLRRDTSSGDEAINRIKEAVSTGNSGALRDAIAAVSVALTGHELVQRRGYLERIRDALGMRSSTSTDQVQDKLRGMLDTSTYDKLKNMLSESTVDSVKHSVDSTARDALGDTTINRIKEAISSGNSGALRDALGEASIHLTGRELVQRRSYTERIRDALGMHSPTATEQVQDKLRGMLDTSTFDKLKNMLSDTANSAAHSAAGVADSAKHSLDSTARDALGDTTITRIKEAISTGNSGALRDALGEASIHLTGRELVQRRSYTERIRDALGMHSPTATEQAQEKLRGMLDTSTFDKLKNMLSDTADSASDSLESTLKSTLGDSTVTKLKNAISSGSADQLRDAVAEATRQLDSSHEKRGLMERFTEALGMHHPSTSEQAQQRLREALGESSLDKLKQALGVPSPSILGRARDMASSSVHKVTDAISDNTPSLDSIRNVLGGHASEPVIDNRGVIDKVKDAVGINSQPVVDNRGVMDKVKDAVGIHSQPVVDNRGVMDKVKDAVGMNSPTIDNRDIVDKIKDALHVSSPNTDSRDLLERIRALVGTQSIDNRGVMDKVKDAVGLHATDNRGVMDKVKDAVGINTVDHRDTLDKIRDALGLRAQAVDDRTILEKIRDAVGLHSQPVLDNRGVVDKVKDAVGLHSASVVDNRDIVDKIKDALHVSSPNTDSRDLLERIRALAGTQSIDNRGVMDKVKDAVGLHATDNRGVMDKVKDAVGINTVDNRDTLDKIRDALGLSAQAVDDRTILEKVRDAVGLHPQPVLDNRGVVDKVKDAMGLHSEPVVDNRGVVDKVKDAMGLHSSSSSESTSSDKARLNEGINKIQEGTRQVDEATRNIHSKESSEGIVDKIKGALKHGLAGIPGAEAASLGLSSQAASTTSVSTWLTHCKGSTAGKFLRTEHFSRSISLPLDIDITKVQAHYSAKQERLEVIIPKSGHERKGILVGLVDEIKDLPHRVSDAISGGKKKEDL